jgi:hypothetical protein
VIVEKLPVMKNISSEKNKWLQLIILFLLIALPVAATSEEQQPQIIERQMLKELLDDRKTRFSDYFNSIEKRSGIFGNKTKKDLTGSNVILTEIVKTDNRIIQVLNRALDYKTFEKTGFNYDKLADEQRIAELLRATDTLNTQRVLLSDTVKIKKKQVLLWKWIAGLSAAAFIIQQFLHRKKIRAIYKKNAYS